MRAQKLFNIKHNVGKVNYLVSFFDGIQRHKDGSKFYRIATFQNKKLLDAFTKQLLQDNYKRE